MLYTDQSMERSTQWQVPIEGGNPEPFTKIPGTIAASVSPDGKMMAFGYYDQNAKMPFQTCIAPVGADTPEKCFGISRSFPRWAADSKAFYYLDHGYTGIWKQPLSRDRVLFLRISRRTHQQLCFLTRWQKRRRGPKQTDARYYRPYERGLRAFLA